MAFIYGLMDPSHILLDVGLRIYLRRFRYTVVPSASSVTALCVHERQYCTFVTLCCKDIKPKHIYCRLLTKENKAEYACLLTPI